MRSRRLLVLLAVALSAVVSLQAAPILNGGFEVGTGSAATFTNYIRCYANGTCGFTPTAGGIDGWTITGEVDYIGALWTAQEGVRSVDLNGGAVTGGVSQSFATVPGQMYAVSFYLSGNPDGGPTIKSLVVEADGQTANFEFDVTGISYSNMGWSARTWYFTADSSSATLVFRTTDATGYGPVIDNVSVSTIPEPASFLLLGAGIFALAGLGRFLRRR